MKLLERIKKKERAKKIPERPASKLTNFTLALTDIIGITELGAIKYRSGYGAVVRVPGIDIAHYREADQIVSYSSYGLSIVSATDAIKIISLDTKPDYSDLIDYYKTKASLETHDYRKYLLERQIEYLRYYQNNDRERTYYIIAYGKTEEAAYENVSAFSNLAASKTNIKELDKTEVVQMLQHLHVKV